MNSAQLLHWHERHARRLGGGAAAVLAIVCGLLLARLAWSLVPPPETQWRPVPVEPARSAGADSGINIERLVAARLFGTFEPPEVAQPAAEDAPETRLSLKLLGVYAADVEERSRAIIAASNGDEKSYAIGDTIIRGVKLHAVFPDRVVISRSGVLETLRMERDQAVAAAGRQAAETPGARSTARGDDLISAPDPQKLGSIRNELLADPSRAGNYIRVVPSASGGSQKGYRVYPGRDRSLFAAAGLRPGDLVTAVNGVSLDDPAKALQLLNELSSASSINVTVERGGIVQNYRLSTN